MRGCVSGGTVVTVARVDGRHVVAHEKGISSRAPWDVQGNIQCQLATPIHMSLRAQILVLDLCDDIFNKQTQMCKCSAPGPG